ncbi:E3 ubiquitin-protein ligase RNF185 [Drosophila takahashii]|uniref:E3 ubiquitin-protein ligase RNF185 n=1 Tax=Drosophila takahashii TaxID=29030 RepID=UPI001CF84E9A|nr:E3 ubiquitin-protein ligase RNF185 [Drosophila takahashii]
MSEESLSKELGQSGTLKSTGTAVESNILHTADSFMGDDGHIPDLKSDTGSQTDKDGDSRDGSLYDCNICLDTAHNAVVTMCGHLFCWPCLLQWLLTEPSRSLCPVCKAAVDKDKVIPLYGRNSTRREDPREGIPPRPAGRRTEPEAEAGSNHLFGHVFHMSVALGFPFGFISSSLNWAAQRNAAANRGTTQFQDEQNLSKFFLYMAFVLIAWLVFA